MLARRGPGSAPASASCLKTSTLHPYLAQLYHPVRPPTMVMFFDVIQDLISLKTPSKGHMPSLPDNVRCAEPQPLATFVREVNHWYSDPYFDRDLENMEYSVRAAFHCKRLSAPQHEVVVLIFTAKSEFKGDTLCVFERMSGVIDKSPTSMALPDVGPSRATEDNPKNVNVNARDRVWCHGDHDWEGPVSSLRRRVVKALKDDPKVQDSPDYNIVACVDFSAAPISLFTILAVLQAASIHKSPNDMLRTNCAWFAAVCMSLLRTLPGAVEVQDYLYDTLKAFIGSRWSALFAPEPNLIRADEPSPEEALDCYRDTHGHVRPAPLCDALAVANDVGQESCAPSQDINPRSIQAAYDELRERLKASVLRDREVSRLLGMRAAHPIPCLRATLLQARAPERGGRIGEMARERDAMIRKSDAMIRERDAMIRERDELMAECLELAKLLKTDSDGMS
ncbi:hypothetical protein EVG20_g2194 [Dentipellis fragilis]|uniref:Uncharacterized protein n=1 Tax=Dentipellis fragilis TaxID=205917 RepID=A0A4Y9ZAE3_9AGAM|nr:hypothetical protein EVG20_g2194 [Dentipellis fragilis]